MEMKGSMCNRVNCLIFLKTEVVYASTNPLIKRTDHLEPFLFWAGWYSNMIV